MNERHAAENERDGEIFMITGENWVTGAAQTEGKEKKIRYLT